MDKKLQHILKQGENERIEFKSSFNDEVMVSLVAFTNTKGGVVYVGVDDKGKINGVHIGKETIAQWVNEVKNKTAPSVIPDVELIETGELKIVALYIQEYPVKPVSFRGKYYKRVKNANHLLQVSEVVNMHLQSLNTSWDAYPDPLHTLDDISLEKITSSMERLRIRGLTITETPLDFLVKNDLLREDKPTHASYLLFKNKHSISTTIELGRFQDAITIKDTSRSQADLIAQVDDVMSFVKKHMTVALIITGEAENKQQWQYPLEAIREIVLNMIIHRDYRANADSVVKIFNNKIEFYNPGKLPDEISVEDLLKNNYKSSPRNKSIAEFFKNIGLIEKYGSGIRRIINYFKEANLPLPTFENHSGGFLVTVYAPDNNQSMNIVAESKINDPVNDPVNDLVNNPVNDPVNDRLSEIKKMISNNKYITREELAQRCKVSIETIKRDILKLKKNNQLTRVGSDKTGYWQLIKSYN